VLGFERSFSVLTYKDQTRNYDPEVRVHGKHFTHSSPWHRFNRMQTVAASSSNQLQTQLTRLEIKKLYDVNREIFSFQKKMKSW